MYVSPTICFCEVCEGYCTCFEKEKVMKQFFCGLWIISFHAFSLLETVMRKKLHLHLVEPPRDKAFCGLVAYTSWCFEFSSKHREPVRKKWKSEIWIFMLDLAFLCDPQNVNFYLRISLLTFESQSKKTWYWCLQILLMDHKPKSWGK